MINKKAISPVVATALLLVVAVVAVVGFQTWFNTYQSGIQAKVGVQSASGAALTVQMLTNGSVYINNNAENSVSVSEIKVTDWNSNPCVGNNSITSIAPDTNEYTFNTSGCTLTKGTIAEVIIVAEDRVYTFTQVVK